MHKILEKGADLSGIKKALFFWAIDLGLRYEPYGQNGFWYELQLKLARKLIFSKWKEGLGGNLDLMTDAINTFLKEYPLGRIGTSEDIAAMAVFLCSDECFLSGQNLQVTGGLTLRRNPRQSDLDASIAQAMAKLEN